MDCIKNDPASFAKLHPSMQLDGDVQVKAWLKNKTTIYYMPQLTKTLLDKMKAKYAHDWPAKIPLVFWDETLMQKIVETRPFLFLLDLPKLWESHDRVTLLKLCHQLGTIAFACAPEDAKKEMHNTGWLQTIKVKKNMTKKIMNHCTNGQVLSMLHETLKWCRLMSVEVQKLKKENERLQRKMLHMRFAPGGPGYHDAKEDFEKNVEQVGLQ